MLENLLSKSEMREMEQRRLEEQYYYNEVQNMWYDYDVVEEELKMYDEIIVG